MESPKSPSPPPLPPSPEPAPRTGFERGCAFAGTAIAGFILFCLGGAGMLAIASTGSNRAASIAGILYLVVAFGVATFLACKPGSRGFSVGIFLGLGAVLLLISICSGTKF